MGIISWIVLGIIAGFVGSKLVKGSGQGSWLLDIVVGVVGAVVGGFIATFLGLGGVSGVNLWSILLAIGGAVVVLMIYRQVTGSSQL
jgi:uncharacterized membrane protein YeaQ/YmgE (transglycosylase-associated protein family)